MKQLKIILELEKIHYNRAQYWKRRDFNNLTSLLKKYGQPIQKWLDIAPLSESPQALAQRLAEKMDAMGIRCCLRHDADYPEACLALDAPPVLLFYMGSLECLCRPVIGIIGARKCSATAQKIAYGMAGNLVRAGMSIVSGMANGIDSAALKGACVGIDFAPAIAVLGTPITRCYPTRNYSLYRHLSAHGCVISEYPPWFETQPYHFVARNGIIAALSDALIVVEAHEKSGAFHTVSAALDIGRPIFVADLPAAGNQRLIESGAQPIRRPEDTFACIFEHLRNK